MRTLPPRLLFAALCAFASTSQAEGLLDFYRKALESSPALRTREFGIDQAKAQEELARSKLLPQLSASGTKSWNDYREAGLAERHYDGMRKGLQARQAVIDLASYYKLESAQFTVAQSEQEREAARLTLASDVVDRYLTALMAEDEIANLRAEKEAVQSQLARARFMYERQLAKLTDMLELEAQFQGLLTREIEAANARAVALERLHEVSGLRAEHVAPLVLKTLPTVLGDEQSWVGEATRRNPHLVALQNAIEAANKAVDSGRAEHLPQLALTATQTYSNQGYDNRSTPPYNVGTLGLQLTIPLYEGGRVQATVREAGARLAIAREQLEAARREVERDARTGYLSAVANRARIGSTEEEVRALEKVVAAQQRSYGLGVSTIVDVVIAQRRLFKARSDRSKALYDYLRDLTTLRARIGTLSLQDIEEMDGWMVPAGGDSLSRPDTTAVSGIEAAARR
jgi:outer membrane protein